MTDNIGILRGRIRILLGLFVVGLMLSGLTAFPLRIEVDLLQRIVGEGSPTEPWWPGLARWISFVHRGVTEASDLYPFLLYGTDWLAFAHLVIAIAFIGPLRDPVRNIWVVEFGIIACLLVIPCALICGLIRGIPFFWRLIDCSFGLVGIIPLYLAWRLIRRVTGLESSAGAMPAAVEKWAT
ncbi:MAG: hypothetical protein JSW27_15540 [Phycisphaerales bacterium]|nr:MAG: hypothetical protein JSW27_15540 [Phycisphaerales bacterium]